MNTKKTYRLSLLVILMLSLPLAGMRRAAQYFKKSVPIVLGIGGIAVTTSFLSTIVTKQQPRLNGENLEPCSNVSMDVEAFAKWQLKRCGYNNHNIIIRKGAGLVYSCASYKGNDYLFMSNDEANNLEHALNSIRIKSIDEFLLGRAAIIQHEGSHLINDDTRGFSSRLQRIGYVTALISGFIGVCAYDQIIKGNNGKGIMICGCIPLLHHFARLAYLRHIEYKADDGIENNIYILKARKKYLKKRIKDIDETLASKPSAVRLVYRILEMALSTHPTDQQRYKRCVERINILKQTLV